MNCAPTFSGGKADITCLPGALSSQVFINEVIDMKQCKLDYCDRKHGANGYCYAHDRQLKNTGKTKPIRKQQNEFVLHDDYAEMALYDAKTGEVKCYTKVDKDQIKDLKKHKWFVTGSYARPYVTGRINRKLTLLHRYLVDSEEHVDHINGDGMDNRKANLRTATQSQNMMNRVADRGDMRGIEKTGDKWSARIKADGERYYLGLYKTLDEAMAARQAGERILFGEYNRKKYDGDT